LGRLSAQALAGWFGRASIYALPARYEPFGLSALEAGLSGCALVLGDIASLREIWEGAAAFVPPDEPEALRAAINELIGDTPRRTRLAEKAHLRALEFTPQRMVEAYLDAYYRVTSRSGTNAGNVHAAELGRNHNRLGVTYAIARTIKSNDGLRRELTLGGSARRESGN